MEQAKYSGNLESRPVHFKEDMLLCYAAKTILQEMPPSPGR